MKISGKAAAALSLALVALDVAMRLAPHAPNFTPLAASALFAAYLFESGVLAAAIPIAALAISDCFIGGYDWHVMATVYLSLAFPVLFRRHLRNGSQLQATRVLTSALGSSIVFFVTTNFAVWYFADLYAGDVASLLQCYVVAIPFFKNTLAGDLFWSCALFGSYAISVALITDAGNLKCRSTAESCS